MSEIYDECLNKYIKLLKDFEGYAKALKIIGEHIEPTLRQESFLDRKCIIDSL
ncbi:MAG: hypothetical protein PHU12_03415 [Candidatus Aenigmarchaeota archaeon]|nr:hypothetical protein [Candidatus Aenigmarchaeota archaeon]